jgi:hypothetical protein
MTITLTKKPVIELKNIKHTAWASEETHCYQATLYVDGNKWGTVSNQGYGGCDDFDGIGGKGYADINTLDRLIKETYPPVTFEGTTETLGQSLEMLCGDLVNQWLRDKDFARAMKSKVLFTKPDVRGVWEVAVKKPQTFDGVLIKMRTKFPEYTYLADLSADEAKALYFAGAGDEL